MCPDAFQYIMFLHLYAVVVGQGFVFLMYIILSIESKLYTIPLYFPPNALRHLFKLRSHKFKTLLFLFLLQKMFQRTGVTVVKGNIQLTVLLITSILSARSFVLAASPGKDTTEILFIHWIVDHWLLLMASVNGFNSHYYNIPQQCTLANPGFLQWSFLLRLLQSTTPYLIKPCAVKGVLCSISVLVVTLKTHLADSLDDLC